MMIVAPPRQLRLLAALLALTACLLPTPCAAGKWVAFRTNSASVSLTDSSGGGPLFNSFFVSQSLPVDAPKDTQTGISLFLSGNLALPSNGSQPVFLFVTGSSFIPLPTSVKPGIISTDYKSQSGAAALTVSLNNFPVQGCVDFCPFPPSDDQAMLLDLDWVAKGERLSAFDSDSRFNSIDYRTKPPSRTGSVFKGKGAQYVSGDVARLRLRRTTPEGNEVVVFESTFACKKEDCTFGLTEEPNRSFSRGP